MSSWWQKKLLRYGLRYALARTGLLEERVLDLDSLDISIGRQNVVELKDVGLNIKQITKLAQLPPCLRLETARVLSLRLIIPADFYQSSIIVEVNGVDLVLKLREDDASGRQSKPHSGQRNRSPTSTRTPQHRKTNRRISSPHPYDTYKVSDSDDSLHVPTAQEVARSFLREEPLQERRELEASVAANATNVEESFVSESSEGADVGTGIGVGVPGFLADFLQGILDRFRLSIKNVKARVETRVPKDGIRCIPLALQVMVGSAEVGSVDVSTDSKRTVTLQDISLALMSEETVLADLSDLPSSSTSSARVQSPTKSRSADSESSSDRSTTECYQLADQEPLSVAEMKPTLPDPTCSPVSSRAQGSATNTDADRFADAIEESNGAEIVHSTEFDIRPGDDNISWGSRRSQASGPAGDDLWRSMVSEDELPESLIIEHERAPTPKPYSSRSTSPLACRQRRAVSPYDRGLYSPGSWPMGAQSHHHQDDDHLEQSSSHLPQSQYSDTHQLHGASPTSIDGTDNKRHALEHGNGTSSAPQTPPEPEGIDASMMESRVFSHEDAQSIYMSAYAGSSHLTMPGGWGSDASSSSPEFKSVPERLSSLDGMVAPAQEPPNLSGPATPRAQSPAKGFNDQTDRVQDVFWVAKELVHIDRLSVSVPSSSSSRRMAGEEAIPDSHQSPQPMPRAGGLPGSFSAYSDMSHSRLRGSGSVSAEQHSVLAAPVRGATDMSRTHSHIEINVGTVKTQIDVSTGRLLHSFSCAAGSIFYAGGEESKKPEDTTTSLQALAVHIDGFELSLRAKMMNKVQEIPVEPDVLTVRCCGASLHSAGDSSLRVRSFAVLLSDQDLLWLENDSEDLSSSQRLAPDSPVLALNAIQKLTVNRRSVTDIAVQTACLRLHVDLGLIEETFGTFGGLSGILELSTSILSESSNGSPVIQKVPKGVRFAGEADDGIAKPEIKVNARLARIVATLKGPQCSVRLKTTTMKAVYREHGAIATIEHIRLTGPHLSLEDPALSINLTTLRVEYLLAPQDKDLERLLSLLTPSKDRYDNDDDILIETLIRQRRKGSLLRLVFGGVNVKINDLDDLSLLSSLGNDLSKLSAVTKYLPEDDRPGLLSLLRVTDFEAQFPINERFGSLRLAAQDIHLAHVGIPPLLAFAVGGISASRLSDNTPLLHSLLPSVKVDNCPAVMARMLGDEEEPMIKIKLFNLCAEYSVPALVALTNVDQPKPSGDVIHTIMESVADLASTRQAPRLQRTPESDMTKMATKRTVVDLLIHDSGTRLTPQHLPSKLLMLLSDVHMSSKIPPEEPTSARIEIRKASVHLTDGGAGGQDDRPPQRTSASEDRAEAALTQQGYVSVGTLFAATATLTAKENANSATRTIEVDVKNELLLLETCADSTFTLMATLGDLAPPTPPSTDPKYLLQPEPIEDVINSFYGEEVPAQDAHLPPEVLFDAEQADGDFDETLSDMPLDASVNPSLLEEEPDELLAESALAGSLYGPVSGIFAIGRDGEDESAVGPDYPDTAESLLEDDPFEMTIAPDERLGDAALLRDLSRQCKPAVNDEPLELDLYEIEDLGYDEICVGPQALGSAHRFNAPYITARRGPKQIQDLPFRLRVRDFSLIWHLHDGYDWQRTREEFTQAVERVEQKAEERRARRRVSRLQQDEEESVIGDFLFNSVYIGIPTSQDAQDLRRQINRNIDEDVSETASVPVSGISRPTTYSASGQPRQRQRRRLKVGRSKNHKIAFDLKGISADVMVYPPGSGEMINSVDLRLKDFEIFDRVPTSTWRKFLTHMSNDPNARELAKPMFHIQLDSVKTLQSHAASEFLLHVAVLPLRLHVDQDALDFITRFFEFKDESMILPAQPDSEKPFIQRIEVETVDLCLDYKPHTLDYAGLRSGKTTEFMNLITLEGANIQLKHLIHYGINGFDQLHPVLNDLWMSEVKRTQLPTILAGLAPMRSLVNLGSGVKDVVAIPLREYKKDGRIVRSIQKGAFHFGKTTTSELARLGAKVALGTQTLLSNAEGLLSPADAAGSSRHGVSRRVSGENWADIAHISDDEDTERRPAVSAYANQPLGLLSGLKSARKYLEHDLLTAKDALIAVQGEFMESRGPGDLAGAVARHAPTVILRPVIGATRAVGTTLLGVGNHIDKSHMRKVDDKYKRR